MSGTHSTASLPSQIEPFFGLVIGYLFVNVFGLLQYTRLALLIIITLYRVQ